ncbi:MAG TPA: sugar ABC transporter permease [Candidatus Limnocylindrales bacterium]
MTQVPRDAQAAAPRQGLARWIQPVGAVAKGVQLGARTMEVDIRLAGMILALIAIWIGFGFASDGLFLTPRNLYDVSVQSVPVAIMATGMVLVIVSRNIDLSVGSIMGFTAYMMAMTQAQWIPQSNGFVILIVALIVGILLGALIGAIQGGLIAYLEIPSFVVTLGGLLIWRGLIFKVQQGQTIAPMDATFSILGGNLPGGSIGELLTWGVGIVICVGIIYALIASRRKRREYGFPVRPQWALVVLMVGGCATVLAAMWAYNSYPLPPLLATKYAVAHGITEPAGGLILPVGLAAPVLLLGAVTLGMMFLTTRRPFGRYVFSIGGNPEAAILAGINTRRTILGTYILLGVLCAIAAAVQTARLDAGVTSTGTGYELLVIAAAVIGGTSFAGGIGTIPGAVLGAVVMQSLKAGMVTIGVDSPMQDVAVGIVLILAVALDAVIQRRAK